MSGHRIIEADLTWVGDHFEPGVLVEVALDGRIARIGRLDRPITTRLEGQALLPGFVNAHSHAFQRGLRGLGERFPEGEGSFWTWRQAMYDLVQRLSSGEFFELTRAAFAEMREAGITTVGEFHYMHHEGSGDYALDRLVIRAAREAGIRLVLLSTYYRTGGIEEGLGPGQRRFASRDAAAYWDAMDALAPELDSRTMRLGAAVHSVRAAGLEEIGAIQSQAERRGMVFHIHVEEQRREIEACREAYQRTPMRALLDHVGSTANVTAVHCTHTEPNDRAEFLDRGGRICVCPLTEAHLGDGVPDLAGVPLDRLCLGSDSNARIDMVEEMRWLEYGQRLRHERRGILRDDRGAVAPSLLHAATAGGADALGVGTGRVVPGALADFQSLRLDAPALRGVPADTLLEAWITGGSAADVAATCVGGVWTEHSR